MKTYGLILLVSAILIFSGCISENGRQNSQGNSDIQASQGGNMQQQKLHDDAHISDLPKEDISPSEIEALNAALDDEYKAHATYAQVIADFGKVRPFSNIIKSEETHISELLKIYAKYDLEPVDDRWTGQIAPVESVAEACRIGVQAEVENADLYDDLFEKVDNQDIIAVFTSLRDASRDKHLPAFQRCGGGR